MTRTNPTIPGFHYDLPDCDHAWPTGMQYAYCPQECDVLCRNRCQDAWNPTRCAAKCEEECMNECLFVPCCTGESTCDDGLNLVRQSCRLSYYAPRQTSAWVTSGGC